MVMGSITCEPKVLANALAAVKAAVSTRSAIQALSGVKIESGPFGNVALSATNWDLTIKRELPATADGNLAVVVSHAELAKVAKAFASAEHVTLTFENQGTDVACSSGQRTITLKALRIQDFPELPPTGGREILQDVNGEYLANAIERVGKCASKDETRPVLTGILLDQEKNGELSLVATDSYRLCVRTLKGLPAWAGGYNVPAKALIAAAKLMRKEANVVLRASGTHAVIEWPGTLVVARLIDGQFPNYRQLMPETWPNQVTMPAGALRAGADLGVQFLTGNAPVRFYVNGVVKLHGESADGPSFEEILPGADVTWDPELTTRELEIGFNPEFLRDIANTLEGETAVVNLISPLRPALIHSEDDSERHLLMPIRLNV